jgi:hypothetical protein
MRHNEQQQKLADDARLLRAWRKWHREELETALAGPHGAMIERLMFILNNLARKSAPLLIAYIRGIDWTTIDYPTRLVVLHEINVAITRLRERGGLSPFDDGMPGDRPNVFQTIRTISHSRGSGAIRSACRLKAKQTRQIQLKGFSYERSHSIPR